LLGSLHRRIAELQATPPNPEDLRAARDYYEKGLRSDWNSHYCGINVIHLSLRLGERARAEELIPRVRDAAEGDAKSNVDFWAYATLGDLEAYAGRKEEAAERYREFVRAVEADTPDLTLRADNLRSCRRPLEENRRIFVGDEFRCLQSAIDASIPIFDSAIARNS